MVEVVVDAESMSRGGMGSITAPIFLRFEGGAYPDEGWSDFPVVILGWWLEGIAAFQNDGSQTFTGRFMDGPYEFTVRRLTAQMAEVSLRSREGPSRPIEISSLLQSVAAAGASVAHACRRNGWRSSDVDALELAVARVATLNLVGADS
jgi:hypothetical protein